MTYYRQCKLVRGATVQVAWIPEQFAVLGKYLMIGDEDGWRVTERSGARQDEEFLQSHEREYLYHRRVTDI